MSVCRAGLPWLLAVWGDGLALLLTVVAPFCGAEAAAASPEADAAVLIARNCLECHNRSDHKGGLDLTQRAAALKGGDSGAALKEGDADASLLVHRIEAGEMPPKGRTPLSAEQRAQLRQWVAAGAKWATD